MQKHFIYSEKQQGDLLTHTEWNNLAQDVDAAVDAINNGGNSGGNNGGSSPVTVTQDQNDVDKKIITIDNVLAGELTSKGDKGTNVSLSGDNNINIEPRPAAGDGSGKNTPGLANRKGGNIALKPGDDIEFWAHKRGTSKNDEVSVKIMTEVPKASDPTKTDEVSAKLQLNTADIVLTSKDKQEDSNVMNITVNQDTNTRGYLKVRAQAIDLRCEDHGGIAIQPKGKDGENHENKIKFEHGGGDGLEFGTFNSEKTSIYTGEYRFKKMGLIKLATRNKIASDKYDGSDSTTKYKYEKNTDDDFYDFVDANDPKCTWKDILSYVVWAKSHQEGPFDISYLLNDQIDNKQRYIIFDSSYAPSTVEDLIADITSIKIIYKQNPYADPTEITLYVNSQIGAGAAGVDEGTYYYRLHFQDTDVKVDLSDPTIRKDVSVALRPDGSIYMDRIITQGIVNGNWSDSINDATEYITNIIYTPNPQT